MEQHLDAMTDNHQGGGAHPDIVDRRRLLDGLDRFLFGELAQ